jgi:glycosyltransferase involved in cell wall biosynthesis
MKAEHPRMIYLARARLHRNRANLLQTLQMLQAFKKLGLAATLYLPPWRRSLNVAERLAEFGVDEDLDVRSSLLMHSRWKNWPFVWFYQRMLRRADIVYARSVPLSLLLCAREIPHYLEIHDTEASRPEDISAIARFQRQGLIRWLLPISAAAKAAMLAAGAEERRLLTAPSGVNLDAFAPIAPYQPPQGRLPRIVYPGSLSRDRGLGIFEALARQGVADIVLLGEQQDTPLASPHLTVKSFAPHREIPNWYAQADMVLLPYQRHLGHAASISPIKLFEAMAAGRPIIASDLPALREIITPGRNGLLVDPEDVQAWAGATRRLLADPQLACRMALAAREDAQAYGWDRRAQSIAQACGWL